MATGDTHEETTVNASGMVTVPASLRRRLDIEAGDKLRWHVEDGDVTVEVVRQRDGAFDDFQSVPMGGGGSEAHDLTGHEGDPSTTSDS